MERLQKIMAQAGVASRRKCEEIIAQRRVKVDGQVVNQPGLKVDLRTSKIEVDDKTLEMALPMVILLNKPRGVISSASDPQKRTTVLDLVQIEGTRLYPVGRLDYNTSGALLLTNDGELANVLTHPKFGAEKKYLVKFHGVVSETQLDLWRNGITLKDGTKTRPVVDIARIDETDGSTWVHVTIKEGKNRQIRRMADATNMQISKLKRISFANITIEGLPVGNYRPLTPKELAQLQKEFDLSERHFQNYNKETDLKQKKSFKKNNLKNNLKNKKRP